MSFEFYNLDRHAQQLVLEYRDIEGVLTESHKMRVTVAYGLERFWGEHLRLLGNADKNATDKAKGKYWRDVWKTLRDILKETGIDLPKGRVDASDTKAIKEVSKELWALSPEDQSIALAVLTQLCDALVWWTQRYRRRKKAEENAEVES